MVLQRILVVKAAPVWTKRDRDDSKWKEVSGPPTSLGRKQAEKTAQPQTQVISYLKGKTSQRVEPRAETVDLEGKESTGGLSLRGEKNPAREQN